MSKRKSKMNQSEIECIICEQIKPRKQYYSTSSYCKDCHKEYMSYKKVGIRHDFIHKCVLSGKLKLENFDAANRLLISCQSRFKACKYNEKGYEEIECNYASPFELFLELLEKEGFFSKWIDLYNCYIADGKKRNSLPVIDRIDEKGHYTPDNVQALTHLENTLKARQIASKAILMSAKGMVCFEFSSKSHFVECLSEYLPAATVRSIDFDTFQPQQITKDTHILLQTKTCKIDAYKMTTEPRFDLTIVYKRYFIDKDTNEIAKTQVLGVERNPINRFVIK